ncbi:hypothetical protein COBT_001049 [Conglomerata obtusa]
MDKLIKKCDRTPVKSDLATLKPIKITVDDILTQLLRTEHNYKQNHLITDFRILIGLISTGLAAILTYLSLYQDFKTYKQTATIILIAYFGLNGVMEVLLRFINRGCIFHGKNEKGTIKIFTHVKAPDSNYVVMVYRNGKSIPEKWDKNVCEMFNEEGVMMHKMVITELDKFFKEGIKED